MRPLTIALLAAMLPLVAAALGLGAYLNFASMRTHYVELVGDRMETASRRVAADAQTALSLGLPLTGQSALGRALERESEADPIIEPIMVVDANGTILFASEEERIGTKIDEAPDPLLARETPIVSPFGTIEGAAVARASQQNVAESLAGHFADIVIGTLLALLAAFFSIIILVSITVGRLSRRVTTQARTRSGALVPAEIAITIERIEQAHDEVRQTLERQSLDRHPPERQPLERPGLGRRGAASERVP